jgi:hypothetical protein
MKITPNANTQLSFDTIGLTLCNTDIYESYVSDVRRQIKESVKIGYFPNSVSSSFQFYDVEQLGREKKEILFAKHQIGSSFYGIVCQERPANKTLSFEFSVPKYWLGNNISALPVRNVNSHQELLDVLKDLLLNFFYDKFGIPILETSNVLDFKDLKLERIDMCYNHTFESVNNLDSYFDYLNDKIIENDKKLVYGSNTVMYKQRDYSYKVYKKGPDFSVHDYKRYLNRYGRRIADDIQETANRTLRFEITYRRNKLNSLFLDNIKKIIPVNPDWVAVFNEQKKIYTYTQNIIEKLFRAVHPYCNLKDASALESAFQKIDNIEKSLLKKYSHHFISLAIQSIKRHIENFGLNLDYQICQEDIRNTILTDDVKKIRSFYLKKINNREIYFEIAKFQKAKNKFSPKVIPFNAKFMKVLVTFFEDIIFNLIPLNKGECVSMHSALKQRKKEIKNELSINVMPLIKYLMIKKEYSVDKTNKLFPKQSRSRWNIQIDTIKRHYFDKGILITDSRNQIDELILFQKIC